MPVVRVRMPVYLPQFVLKRLRWIKLTLLERRQPRLNLWGDRSVEWSFIAAHMLMGPGEALDFGSGASHMSLIAARRGFRVTALDLEPQLLPWRHSSARLVQGDLLQVTFPANHFDIIINC